MRLLIGILILVSISSCCNKVDCSNQPLPSIARNFNWPDADTIFIFEYKNGNIVSENYLINNIFAYNLSNTQSQFKIALIKRDSVVYTIDDIYVNEIVCGGDCLFSKSTNKIPNFISMRLNGDVTTKPFLEISN